MKRRRLRALATGAFLFVAATGCRNDNPVIEGPVPTTAPTAVTAPAPTEATVTDTAPASTAPGPSVQP